MIKYIKTFRVKLVINRNIGIEIRNIEAALPTFKSTTLDFFQFNSNMEISVKNIFKYNPNIIFFETKDSSIKESYSSLSKKMAATLNWKIREINIDIETYYILYNESIYFNKIKNILES